MVVAFGVKVAVTAVGLILVSVPLFQEVNASYLRSLENLREPPPNLPPPEDPPPVNISIPIPPGAAAFFCANAQSDEVEYPAMNLTSEDPQTLRRDIDVPDQAVGGRLEAGWIDANGFSARVETSAGTLLAEIQEQPQPSSGREALSGHDNDTFEDVTGPISLIVDPGNLPNNPAITPQWGAIVWLRFRCSEVTQ